MPSGPNWKSTPTSLKWLKWLHAINEQVEHEVDDNNIDMNPLIDVCLVLLVFFILATTMSVMEKVMKLPSNKQANTKPRPLTPEQAQKYIMLKLEKKGSETIYNVNDIRRHRR